MPVSLVVEDDQAIREVVAFHLSRAGHEVREACDGVAALQQLQSSPPDLVVLDLMLPRMLGFDVLRSLREHWSMPVIVISARLDERGKVRALGLGADDYITKPFSVREFVARVEAVLRRAQPAAEPPISATDGRIVVDVARHEVLLAGEPVSLAPKEFELLAHLARHPNQVCSRDAILNAVWGYEYGGETRTVDVHIHWLRQKLEPDPSRPVHLVTVRHYGYKFVPLPAEESP
ncbi:MAG: response regulator [Dehalococcoidia bacterium]|nr:response regulator [Dehalococcoidia bacterium]